MCKSTRRLWFEGTFMLEGHEGYIVTDAYIRMGI